MKLYNQGPNTLRWEMVPHGMLTCEPWGAIDLPEDAAVKIVKMGVPLGPSPVPPEHKARAVAEHEEAKARNTELEQLKRALLDAQERVASQDRELLDVKSARDRLSVEVSEWQSMAKESESAKTAAELERDAFKAKFAEQAARIADLHSAKPVILPTQTPQKSSQQAQPEKQQQRQQR